MSQKVQRDFGVKSIGADMKAEAARLQALKDLAVNIQSHPIQAGEDELMRMVRIADEVDAQWRHAVNALIRESDNLPLNQNLDAAYVLRKLRGLKIVASR